MNYIKYLYINALCVFCISNYAGTSADLAATRSLVKDWIAAEKALSDEHNAWEAKRQLLDDLLDLKAEEVAALRASIAVITENATQADKARSELVMQRDTLETHRSTVVEFLEGITPTIRAFQSWVPEPLQAQLDPLFKKMAAVDAPVTTSLAEAMQAMVAILQALNQFDQSVTVHSSLRSLEGGQQVEVETVYLGLGIAYYRSLSGLLAGYGQPTKSGWNWTAQSELAPAIADALAVANQQVQAAGFIQLPVTIAEE
jgi:hypothetical protein